MSQDVIFATLTLPGRTAEVALFVESLRAFGGAFADSDFYVFLPEKEELSSDEKERFDHLNIHLESLPLKPEAKGFPFAAKVYASALAESHLKDAADILFWSDPDVLVLKPPEALNIPARIKLAYRPVHHTLIGSKYNEPLDPFWELAYRHCGVQEDKAFPMDTCVKDHVIRPYFNAGVLVVDPKVGMLSAWEENFDRLYQHPDFVPFYQDQLYKIFVHQIILSATVIAMMEQAELWELPETINYPLHLHRDMPTQLQPKTLNQLVTARYDDLNQLPRLLGEIGIVEPLNGWLRERIDF
jgi:hypothetical protein